MRCPKCGYTSFDHLESCKKCQKHLGDIVEQIKGTTYNAAVPFFLKVVAATDSTHARPTPAIEPGEPSASSEVIQSVREATSDFTLDLETEPETERKEIEFPGGSEELVMELNDFSEVSPQADFALDLDMEKEDEDSQLPQLDFADLDISDLAPPTKEAEPVAIVNDEETGELELATAFSPLPLSSTQESSGLEDLNFNGLDLEAPAKLISGSAAGKRFLPSVKTGTALDKFDIDLGDLFTDKKA